jgi:hypothetical protein
VMHAHMSVNKRNFMKQHSCNSDCLAR